MGKDLSAAYAYIDEIRDETIALYKEFVNRESWSKTPDKVRIFSDFLKGEMEKAGFECRYVPVGVNADTLVGILGKDRPGKPILFCGHMAQCSRQGCIRKTRLRLRTEKRMDRVCSI